MFRNFLCLFLALCALGSCLIGCKKEPVVNNDLFPSELSENAVVVQFVNHSSRSAFWDVFYSYAKENPEECGDPTDYAQKRLTLADERVGEAIAVLQACELTYIGEAPDSSEDSREEIAYGGEGWGVDIILRDGTTLTVLFDETTLVTGEKKYQVTNKNIQAEIFAIFGVSPDWTLI